MIVWHPSPSGISDRFIDTTDTTGDNNSDDANGTATSVDLTFLCHSFGIGILVTSGDLDQLRRL